MSATGPGETIMCVALVRRVCELLGQD
ncbi:MAG: hypothetical protein H5T41_01420 [Methanomassiliicoccales archaeon]|nr:hypothetical protein [Methanomassiliicoccales archaeon]